MLHKSKSGTPVCEDDELQQEGELLAFRVVCWSDDWLYYMNGVQRWLYEKHRDRMNEMTKRAEMWAVYHGKEPVMFLGLNKYSLIGNHTYLWTVPFREFCWLHLRDLKRLLERNRARWDVLTAVVMDGRGRMARFCGFDFSHTENGNDIYVRR